MDEYKKYQFLGSSQNESPSTKNSSDVNQQRKESKGFTGCILKRTKHSQLKGKLNNKFLEFFEELNKQDDGADLAVNVNNASPKKNTVSFQMKIECLRKKVAESKLPQWKNYEVFKPKCLNPSLKIIDLEADCNYIISESSDYGKLFPGDTVLKNGYNMDSFQLIKMNRDGLVNVYSKFEGYTIFGTSSLSYNLSCIEGNFYIEDNIDIHLNLNTRESYQIFYVAYDYGKFSLINSIIRNFIFRNVSFSY